MAMPTPPLPHPLTPCVNANPQILQSEVNVISLTIRPTCLGYFENRVWTSIADLVVTEPGDILRGILSFDAYMKWLNDITCPAARQVNVVLIS
jgi:hypothetical protein